MKTKIDELQRMLSPWGDRADFEDDHDEALHLVKGKGQFHESNAILEIENRT